MLLLFLIITDSLPFKMLIKLSISLLAIVQRKPKSLLILANLKLSVATANSLKLIPVNIGRFSLLLVA